MPATAGALSGFVVAQFPTGPALLVNHPAESYSQPTVGAGTILLTQRAVRGDGTVLGGDIAFTSSTNISIAPLTPVNGALDESRPAFSPDGRYVAFVRRSIDGFRLQVFDTQTQTTVSSGSGPSLGTAVAGTIGSVSVYTKDVFKLVKISGLDTISFDLAQATGVGIIVQRVVGHHKLLGRTVPTLKPVGRVPFGRFKKGRGDVKWNRRVNGRRLKPGRYQVTVRAVTPKRQILDLGRPKIIRVR
jgi:hypothetical protein